MNRFSSMQRGRDRLAVIFPASNRNRRKAVWKGGMALASVLVGLGVTACAQPAVAAAKPDPVPAAAPAPAPVRAAPSRPAAKLWPFVRLRGADYVSLKDVAKHFGLKLAWGKPTLTQTLADSRGVRFNFENNQRDFFLDGQRIFMGAPVLLEKDGLWISKLDLIKIVAPLFRPNERAALLPATAPRTIVLDAGHGGIDPGTENKKLGLNEKTLALDVVLRLRKLLEREGWKVLLTRSDDRELSRSKIVDLQMRADFANRHAADLFLSIHFNAADAAVSGVEVYSLPAQFMLSSSSDRKDELTDQVFPNNRFDYANLLLGAALHRSLLATLKTPDRGYKRARWGVLRPVECPAVLVECAYLSNTAEAGRAATPEFRQKVAEAISDGVRNYAAELAVLRPAAPGR